MASTVFAASLPMPRIVFAHPDNIAIPIRLENKITTSLRLCMIFTFELILSFKLPEKQTIHNTIIIALNKANK